MIPFLPQTKKNQRPTTQIQTKGEKLQKNKEKQSKLKLIISLLLIVATTTNCTTNQKRDKALVKSLSVQNKTIDELIVTQGNHAKKCQHKGVELSSKGLMALKKSNEVIISKLKTDTKKECNCGTN